MLTGNHTGTLRKFVQALSSQFSLKDLGALNYFLGIEVESNPNSLYLSQWKYVHNLLDQTGTAGAKDMASLMCSTATITLNYGSGATNAKLYKQVMGSLKYLSVTRPDIGFIVNKMSQFMYCPT